MTPILQIMIGVGLGLLGAILITYKAIEYNQQGNTPRNRNRRNEKKGDFFAEPGKRRCPICLDTMNDVADMQYLNCGHALHDNCYREVKRRTKQCPECRANI